MSPDSSRPTELTVRPAVPDDVDAVYALVAGVAAERRWLASEPPLDPERRRKWWLSNLRARRGTAFVAVDGERIVGELSLWPGRWQTVVLGMLVHERWRRRGVGSRLIEAAIEWSRRLGSVRTIELSVFPHNDAGRALYGKYGFVERGLKRRAIPRQNGEMWDVIVMTLAL